MLYTLTSPPIVSLPRTAPMPLIGLHLASNVYICSKGNALAYCSTKLCIDALRYLLALAFLASSSSYPE